MTGAVMGSVLGVTTATGGGSGGTGGSWAWANIYGLGSPANAPITVSGVGAGLTLPLTASLTGGAQLYYILNGATAAYAGAFNVADGNTLAWGVISSTTTAGTITVSSGGSSLASFTYYVRQPGGGGHY